MQLSPVVQTLEQLQVVTMAIHLYHPSHMMWTSTVDTSALDDWVTGQISVGFTDGVLFSLSCAQRAASLSSLTDGPAQRLRLALRPPVLAAPLWRELPPAVLPAGAIWEQYVCVCVCPSVLYSPWVANSCSLAVYQAVTHTHLQEADIWRMVLLRKLNVHPGSL